MILPDKLRIRKIELYSVKIPLERPFTISRGTIYHASNLWVKILTNENDVFGFGEGCSFSSILGELPLPQFEVAKILAGQMIEENPLEIEFLHRKLDSMTTFNSAVKSAFDIAMHDLSARYAGLPLYRFLGGKKSKAIRTNMTIGLGTPDEMANLAKEYSDRGFDHLKIKLGGEVEEDLKRIIAIRKAIGINIPLKIDANQGWSYSEAFMALEKLSKYNVWYCEAPIKARNLSRLKLISQKSEIPIMADESLFDHIDAHNHLMENACHMINIKLGKSGGIRRAGKIAALAESASIQCQLGCFLETRLGITAAAHFALSSESIVFFDLDSPLMQSSDPIQGGIHYGRSGEITWSDQPGLGISWNLEEVEVVQSEMIEKST